MRELQTHSLYKHYKGKLYYVHSLALHSETGELMVVYHALYDYCDMYVRPFEMFMSEVDEEQPNPTGQRYRFEHVNGGADNE